MPGIRLGRILGIRISIDYTWFIVFALFAWSLSAGYFPQHVPGLTRPEYFLMGAVAALLLFICVLIHELSHSYVSNLLGLGIDEITLFIFGGVARLSREPDDAKTELKIAVAGPVASLVLAGLFFLLREVLDRVIYAPVISEVIGFLVFINLALLVFNMIPGFPLDGGRVLRALWWMKTGDLKRSTRVASRIGKGFAAFLIVMGFFQLASGYFIQGLWGILIGAFLRSAAESTYKQTLIKTALQSVKVSDVMTRNVLTIEENMPLRHAVENFFFTHHFVGFPVTSVMGRVVGFLALGDVRAIPREKWDSTPIKDVMRKLSAENTVSPQDSALTVLTRMANDNVGRYPVMENNELVGIISRRDIMKTMEFKSELEG